MHLLQICSKESELSMNNATKVWIHSLAVAAIGGAAGALGLVIVSPSSVTWTLAGARSLGEAALIGAVIPVLALLKQSPLPGNTTDSTKQT
jgi:hypothetical protein